jgi:hypothetical protein
LIDGIVYELYGLTDEEIAIVEETVGGGYRGLELFAPRLAVPVRRRNAYPRSHTVCGTMPTVDSKGRIVLPKEV